MKIHHWLLGFARSPSIRLPSCSPRLRTRRAAAAIRVRAGDPSVRPANPATPAAPGAWEGETTVDDAGTMGDGGGLDDRLGATRTRSRTVLLCSLRRKPCVNLCAPIGSPLRSRDENDPVPGADAGMGAPVELELPTTSPARCAGTASPVGVLRPLRLRAEAHDLASEGGGAQCFSPHFCDHNPPNMNQVFPGGSSNGESFVGSLTTVPGLQAPYTDRDLRRLEPGQSVPEPGARCTSRTAPVTLTSAPTRARSCRTESTRSRPTPGTSSASSTCEVHRAHRAHVPQRRSGGAHRVERRRALSGSELRHGQGRVREDPGDAGRRLVPAVRRHLRTSCSVPPGGTVRLLWGALIRPCLRTARSAPIPTGASRTSLPYLAAQVSEDKARPRLQHPRPDHPPVPRGGSEQLRGHRPEPALGPGAPGKRRFELRRRPVRRRPERICSSTHTCARAGISSYFIGTGDPERVRTTTARSTSAPREHIFRPRFFDPLAESRATDPRAVDGRRRGGQDRAGRPVTVRYRRAPRILPERTAALRAALVLLVPDPRTRPRTLRDCCHVERVGHLSG